VTKTLLVLRFMNLFCIALTSGGLVMVLVAVYPSIFLPVWWPFSTKKFDSKVTAELHRAIDLRPDTYMRPSTIVAGVTALLILILHHGLTPFITTSTIIGLIGTLGIILTSEFLNVPINRIVHSWKDDYVPQEYPKMLARWGFFHVVRTLFSLLALVCYIIAALAY
jgi:hypothetical protein